MGRIQLILDYISRASKAATKCNHWKNTYFLEQTAESSFNIWKQVLGTKTHGTKQCTAHHFLTGSFHFPAADAVFLYNPFTKMGQKFYTHFILFSSSPRENKKPPLFFATLFVCAFTSHIVSVPSEIWFSSDEESEV